MPAPWRSPPPFCSSSSSLERSCGRGCIPRIRLEEATLAPTVGKAELGKTAPQFQVPTTAGLFDLQKQTQPVFLELFASWCPHCQHETAVINKLYDAYHSRIAFVAVSASDTGMDGTSPESENDVYNFTKRFHDALSGRIRRPGVRIEPVSPRRLPDHRRHRPQQEDHLHEHRRDLVRRSGRRN